MVLPVASIAQGPGHSVVRAGIFLVKKVVPALRLRCKIMS